MESTVFPSVFSMFQANPTQRLWGRAQVQPALMALRRPTLVGAGMVAATRPPARHTAVRLITGIRPYARYHATSDRA